MGIGPCRSLGVEDASADFGSGLEYRDSLEPEMEHQFVRLADAARGFHADGGRRHVFARRFVRKCLGVEMAQDCFAHLVHGHAAHRGRCRIRMPPTPQSRANAANIDGIAAAAGNNLNAVGHAAYGKQDCKALHFHDLVRQVGKISQIMLKRSFGQNNVHTVDRVVFG